MNPYRKKIIFRLNIPHIYHMASPTAQKKQKNLPYFNNPVNSSVR